MNRTAHALTVAIIVCAVAPAHAWFGEGAWDAATGWVEDQASNLSQSAANYLVGLGEGWVDDAGDWAQDQLDAGEQAILESLPQPDRPRGIVDDHLACGKINTECSYPDGIEPPTDIDFDRACDWHDRCYMNLAKTKTFCDNGFLGFLADLCYRNADNFGELVECLGSAQGMRWAMETSIADDAYDQGQERATGCVESSELIDLGVGPDHFDLPREGVRMGHAWTADRSGAATLMLHRDGLVAVYNKNGMLLAQAFRNAGTNHPALFRIKQGRTYKIAVFAWTRRYAFTIM